jgi:L1 cell adhesion molecule like protein
MKEWPFKVIADPNEKPMISVTYKNELKKFYAEEISAMLLSRLKEVAEEYL